MRREVVHFTTIPNCEEAKSFGEMIYMNVSRLSKRTMGPWK